MLIARMERRSPLIYNMGRISKIYSPFCVLISYLMHIEYMPKLDR